MVSLMQHPQDGQLHKEETQEVAGYGKIILQDVVLEQLMEQVIILMQLLLPLIAVEEQLPVIQQITMESIVQIIVQPFNFN